MENIENLSLSELKEIAKNKEIKNVSKLKKEELIKLLSEEDSLPEENIERYKVTSETDTIVEGILEVLPDGYGFLRGENYLPTPKMYIFLLYKLKDLNLIQEI